MNTLDLSKVRFDERGLVPVVVQDFQSGSVLMLAYMNRESVQRTVDTGQTHFWSRSRGELWHKGETSGNTQRVKGISLDCDSDALLVRVDQKGSACHTGEFSCFFNPLIHTRQGERGLGETLGDLARVIHQRAVDQPSGSYTAFLVRSGLDTVLKKVGEEAGETIVAAKNHDPKEIAREVADLLYHLLLMLEIESVSLDDISGVLRERSSAAPRAEDGS